MKTGYSFGSLASFVEQINNTTVKLTGDQVIAGSKTFSSNPISSAAQGSGGAYLTRRDFVENLLSYKAPTASPVFTGNPTAPTAALFDADTTVATTAFVQRALGNHQSYVWTGDATIQPGWAGCFIWYVGAGTLYLPDYHSVSMGATFEIMCTGAGAITAQSGEQIILPNGAQINSFTPLAGDTVKFIRLDTAWAYSGSNYCATAATGDRSTRPASTQFVRNYLESSPQLAGNVHVEGNVNVTQEFQTTNAAGYRIAYGDHGAFWYFDSWNMYLMFTNSGDKWGGYGGLRPFSANCKTGRVTMSNGVSVNDGLIVTGGVTGDSLTVTGASTLSGTVNCNQIAVNNHITVPTLAQGSNDVNVANTAWVQRELQHQMSSVSSAMSYATNRWFFIGWLPASSGDTFDTYEAFGEFGAWAGEKIPFTMTATNRGGLQVRCVCDAQVPFYFHTNPGGGVDIFVYLAPYQIIQGQTWCNQGAAYRFGQNPDRSPTGSQIYTTYGHSLRPAYLTSPNFDGTVGMSGTLSVGGTTTTSGLIVTSGTDFRAGLTVSGGAVFFKETLSAIGEISSQGANAFRMVQGNYGAFWRNDGYNLYLMFTNSGDAWGTWNGLRPLVFDLSNGRASFDNGINTTSLGVIGGIACGSLAVSGNATVNGNVSAGDVVANNLISKSSYNQVDMWVTSYTKAGLTKKFGTTTDAKPFMIVVCPMYAGVVLAKTGLIGKITISRGTTSTSLLDNYVDFSIVTAYNGHRTEIFHQDINARIVTTTYNNTQCYALYFDALSAVDVLFDGIQFDQDFTPTFIADATGYSVKVVGAGESYARLASPSFTGTVACPALKISNNMAVGASMPGGSGNLAVGNNVYAPGGVYGGNIVDNGKRCYSPNNQAPQTILYEGSANSLSIAIVDGGVNGNRQIEILLSDNTNTTTNWASKTISTAFFRRVLSGTMSVDYGDNSDYRFSWTTTIINDSQYTLTITGVQRGALRYIIGIA